MLRQAIIAMALAFLLLVAAPQSANAGEFMSGTWTGFHTFRRINGAEYTFSRNLPWSFTEFWVVRPGWKQIGHPNEHYIRRPHEGETWAKFIGKPVLLEVTDYHSNYIKFIRNVWLTEE
jgi:hypothetical protein